MPRTDLLELTPEALIALANAGFVKRAQKELDEGRPPTLNEAADGTLTARFHDGTLTSLASHATLRDAQCSCPASGMCRHRVLLVLAYQQHCRNTQPSEPAANAAPNAAPTNNANPTSPTHTPEGNESIHYWTPALFANAVAAFPAATLKQACVLAAAHPVLHLAASQPGAPIPSARLPMCNVRFFSRNNVAHARCDCKQGSGCAHVVVAVWAFIQAEQRQPDFSTLTIEVRPPHTDTEKSASTNHPDNNGLSQLHVALNRLSLQLWLDGARQSQMGLDGRFEQALACAHACEALWISDTLEDLRNGIHALQQRSNRIDPLDLLKLVVHLQARHQAAAHARAADMPALPASQIMGAGIKGEVALDHLRLVSVGAHVWSDQHEEGANLLFVDPDTLAVTVIERSWPHPQKGEPQTALRDRRVAGQPLRALATSQIVTKAAKRRANGRLDIATGARNTNVMPLSPQSWDTIGAPIHQPHAEALRQHLLNAPPTFASPRQAVEHLHILPITQVLDWGWDAAGQTLFAELLTGKPGHDVMDDDEEGQNDSARLITLTLKHDALTPQAVDALACALAGHWGALTHVAGVARLDAMRLQIDVLAVLTTQKAVVPAFEHVDKQSLPVKALPAVASPQMTPLRDTLDLLALWLRQGLRHQGAHALQRGEAQACALADAGWLQTATLLRVALKTLTSNDPGTLPDSLARLVLMMETLAKHHLLSSP